MNKVDINNCLFKSYLIGSMESPANNDEGKGWRQVLTPRLNERGIYCFDPTREEISKVGMSTKKFIKKVKQYQQDDARDKFITSMDKIWKGVDKISEVDKKVTSVHIIGDIGYVENSDFLVWNWDKGDQPGGSIIEATIAWYRKIPIYLISEMEAAEFNTSIYYFILSSGGNQGQHFNNQADLLEFIDKKYNLKIKQ